MKKFITLFLVTLLLISIPTLADGKTETDSQFVGGTVVYSHDDNDRPIAMQGNASGALLTRTKSVVDSTNSTATPLGVDGVFTGTWTDILECSVLIISLTTDEDSATDGLEVEFSSTGSEATIISSDEYTVVADAKKTFSFQPAARYVRVKYTNGGTEQTKFIMQTVCHGNYVKPSSHRIQDSIVDDDDAELVKAVLTGKNPQDAFVNFQSTTAGNFKISIEELETGISSNTKTQLNVTPFHADGTEGALVSGFNYVSGKSGIDASTEAQYFVRYPHHEIHTNSHYFIEDYTTLGNAAVLDFCMTTSDTAAWVHLLFNYKSSLEMVLDIYEVTDMDADGTLVVQYGNNRAKCFAGIHTAGTSATIMTDSAASFTEDALIGWKIYNITDLSYGIVTDNDTTTVTVASLVGGTDNDWDTSDQYEINRSLTIVESGCTINSVGIRLGGSQGGSGTTPATGRVGTTSREEELVLRQNTNYLFRFTSGAAANDLEYTAEWYEHTDKN